MVLIFSRWCVIVISSAASVLVLIGSYWLVWIVVVEYCGLMMYSSVPLQRALYRKCALGICVIDGFIIQMMMKLERNQLFDELLICAVFSAMVALKLRLLILFYMSENRLLVWYMNLKRFVVLGLKLKLGLRFWNIVLVLNFLMVFMSFTVIFLIVCFQEIFFYWPELCGLMCFNGTVVCDGLYIIFVQQVFFWQLCGLKLGMFGLEVLQVVDCFSRTIMLFFMYKFYLQVERQLVQLCEFLVILFQVQCWRQRFCQLFSFGVVRGLRLKRLAVVFWKCCSGIWLQLNRLSVVFIVLVILVLIRKCCRFSDMVFQVELCFMFFFLQ